MLNEKDYTLLNSIEFNKENIQELIYEIYNTIQCIIGLKEQITELLPEDISQIESLLNLVDFLWKMNQHLHGP